MWQWALTPWVSLILLGFIDVQPPSPAAYYRHRGYVYTLGSLQRWAMICGINIISIASYNWRYFQDKVEPRVNHSIHPRNTRHLHAHDPSCGGFRTSEYFRDQAPSISDRGYHSFLDETSGFYAWTVKTVSRATVSAIPGLVRRLLPRGSRSQVPIIYSIFSLQQPGLNKRPADIEVINLSLTRLIELLQKDQLMNESGDLLVADSIDFPRSVTLDSSPAGPTTIRDPRSDSGSRYRPKSQ